VQTVARQTNPRFWALIDAFAALTGVPVLLNTSFNNNAEPIVDSVDDAVVSFLTTGLDHLVVGDFVIEKRALDFEACRPLVLALAPYASLVKIRAAAAGGRFAESRLVANSYDDRTVPVSQALFRALDAVDGQVTLGDIVAALAVDGPALFPELVALWQRRLVTLLPRS
jgi:carbamoyltransferase